MTRFARAKGSKSSNSRSAEDATDWKEFKRQPEKPTNEYSAVVKKTIKQIKEGGPPKASAWADFGVTAPQATSKSKEKSSKGEESNEKPKRKRTRKQKKPVGGDGDEGANKKVKPEDPEKSSQSRENSISNESNPNVNGKFPKDNESITKPKRKRKHKKSVGDEGDEGAQKKPKANEPEKASQSHENSTSNETSPHKNGNFQKGNKSHKKPKGESNANQNGKFQKGNQSIKKPKSGIQLPDGTFKKRKPVESRTLQINGTSVQVIKFDGYDIKQEDAVRLKEIRQKMHEAGIPKAEIDMAMKRERRNAERALHRELKKVCFNCRKAGHPLSECPELVSSEFKNVEKTGTSNICYKCGSTEHTHFQCQVKKNKEYSFATCFICKEQGHISSQCPDNPRGLYPKGGSCKVCGEVTHLKKDCPQLAKDRTENVVTLDTFSSTSNVESLEDKVNNTKPFNKTPRQNKIIKF
ncbi:zinc finger CCHC domain-containing protein 9-like [Thrips palmi]|uniref:Zinc finger CCHC domain-containing protein 9-like n=1 Tax=Thrips palmi TaxID=161013 RepID=A0A6P8YX61_THRPL|nr:zinc finger CCHC domain-containing protein 9-like [Thrips palmi]